MGPGFPTAIDDQRLACLRHAVKCKVWPTTASNNSGRTKPHEANIYVVRKARLTGSAVAFEVKLDGTSVGSLSSGTFLLIEVEPGEHILSSQTPENQAVCSVDAVAGKNYFFELKPRWGMMAARCSLTELDEETGMQEVMKTSLAEDLQVGD